MTPDHAYYWDAVVLRDPLEHSLLELGKHHYSNRKARMGSTAVARRAGR